MRPWHRLGVRVGRRGAALMFFALADLVFAYAMIALTPRELAASPVYRFASTLMPLGVWSSAWALVGVVCVIQAFQRTDRIAFGLASLIKVAWGAVQLAGWVIGDVPRGYVGATVWLAFAGFVQVIAGWRENGDR